MATAAPRGLPRGSHLLPRRADLRSMLAAPRADLAAGVTTGIVALPLALAFGVSSGMGARAGLVTAIVAGVVAAVLGGSRVQVSGPTGAMAVVLLPVAAAYGAGGVLVAGMLAGAVLVLAGALRLGRYVGFLPLPVVEGFTAGIAAVITLQQVPAALGVTDAGAGRTVVVAGRAVGRFLAAPTLAAAGLALVVAVLMLLGARIAHAFPASLLAVAVATVVAEVSRLDVPRIGTVPAGLPLPALPHVAWAHSGALVGPAVAIAALAGIESLLSATVADGLAGGPRHDPDRELFGQGVANVVVPLFGGMPATGAIARTAVSIRAGAGSRLAAVVHALLLLLVVLVLAPVVGRVPLAALAGVLLVTAARMVDWRAAATLVRTSRSSAVVLVATFATTVLFDLVRAVEIGLVVAGALALRQVARTARLDRLPAAHPDHALPESAHDLIDEHVVVFRLDGSLFFATAHRLLGEVLDVAAVRVVVLRLSRITVLDATGARVLGDVVSGLESRGVTVLLSGLRPEHRTLLERLGVLSAERAARHLFDSVDRALEHARAHVAAGPELAQG